MPKVFKGQGQGGQSAREAFTPSELPLIFDSANYLEETAQQPSRF
ncbi:hypothetical protein DFAR_910010 [Desulfarculales bacterium]